MARQLFLPIELSALIGVCLPAEAVGDETLASDLTVTFSSAEAVVTLGFCTISFSFFL